MNEEEKTLKKKIGEIKKKVEDFRKAQDERVKKIKVKKEKFHKEIKKIDNETDKVQKLNVETSGSEIKVDPIDTPEEKENEIIAPKNNEDEKPKEKEDPSIIEPVDNDEISDDSVLPKMDIGSSFYFKLREFFDEWGNLILKIFLGVIALILVFYFGFNFIKGLKFPSFPETQKKEKVKVDSQAFDLAISEGTCRATEPLFDKETISFHLREIMEARNLLKTDIQKELSNSSDREKTYETFLAKLIKHKENCNTNIKRLESNINILETELKNNSQKKNARESDFFDFIKNGRAAEANRSMQEFIDFKKKEAEIKAHLGALNKVREFYIFYYPKIETLEKSLIANREALISGIEIVIIKNMPFDFIKSESEWESQNK